jgi:mono/diheme cytochrome c family protein
MPQSPERNQITTLKQIIGWSLMIFAVLLFAAGTFIKIRGFRASSRPSAFETTVARAVRNFSIPSAESHQTNPFANDELALRQGRDLFLSRCASCHGVDGRGTTPIGSNIYPRVPDLHARPTQDMSDGQIHYVIENGVRLTGMPAMPGLRSPSKSDSWALVSYVRSLRAATADDMRQQVASVSGAHYVGSQSCQSCHASIYER